MIWRNSQSELGCAFQMRMWELQCGSNHQVSAKVFHIGIIMEFWFCLVDMCVYVRIKATFGESAEYKGNCKYRKQLQPETKRISLENFEVIFIELDSTKESQAESKWRLFNDYSKRAQSKRLDRRKRGESTKLAEQIEWLKPIKASKKVLW